ncbi:hypothetical protein AAHK20_15610 [Trinickia sp. YCB016]
MNEALRPSIGVDVDFDEELPSLWKSAAVPKLTRALQARNLFSA